MRDLERALVLADVDREGVTGLGVVDRERHAIVVLMPQQPHLVPSLIRLSNSRI